MRVPEAAAAVELAAGPAAEPVFEAAVEAAAALPVPVHFGAPRRTTK